MTVTAVVTYLVVILKLDHSGWWNLWVSVLVRGAARPRRSHMVVLGIIVTAELSQVFLSLQWSRLLRKSCPPQQARLH